MQREPVETKKEDNLVWLVAPQDIELPTGFPFTKLSGNMLDMATRLLEGKEAVVVAVDADQVDKIKTLADIRGAVLRHLEHTVGDYTAYWHLQTKSMPSITVKEVMETRAPEGNQGEPPKLTKDDIATYDQRLSTLADEDESSAEV